MMHAFVFSSFRFVRLLYTLPLAVIVLVYCGSAIAQLDVVGRLLRNYPHPAFIIFLAIIVIGLFALIVQLFFWTNLGTTSIIVDAEGFTITRMTTKRVAWRDIKTYSLASDKYDVRSGERPSTIVLSTKNIRLMYIVYSSDWLWYHRLRREREKAAYYRFMDSLVHHCPGVRS